MNNRLSDLECDKIIDVLREHGSHSFQIGLDRLTVNELHHLKRYCRKLLRMIHDPFIVMVYNHVLTDINIKKKRGKKK